MAISNDGIAKLTIPLPPLAEQDRITRILDESDVLRRLRTEADGRTGFLASALYFDMFGDNHADARGCRDARLEELTTRVTDGIHLKPVYTESGVPFISVKDVTTRRLRFDDCRYISSADHERFTKRCKPEYLDILYTKVGATYGRAAVVDTDREFSIYVSVCLIKPNKSLVEPLYLSETMNSPAVKNQADQRIKGIGVPDLHLDQIREFLVSLPPMERQREFASRVGQIHGLEASQRASRSGLDELFESLLSRAFVGDL